MLSSVLGDMQRFTGLFSIQLILIVFAILLILVGFGTGLIIDANSATTTTLTHSFTNQPLNDTNSLIQVIRTLPAYPYPMIPEFIDKDDVNDDNNYVPVPSKAISQDDFRWLGQDLFTPSVVNPN